MAAACDYWMACLHMPMSVQLGHVQQLVESIAGIARARGDEDGFEIADGVATVIANAVDTATQRETGRMISRSPMGSGD